MDNRLAAQRAYLDSLPASLPIYLQEEFRRNQAGIAQPDQADFDLLRTNARLAGLGSQRNLVREGETGEPRVACGRKTEIANYLRK